MYISNVEDRGCLFFERKRYVTQIDKLDKFYLTRHKIYRKITDVKTIDSQPNMLCVVKLIVDLNVALSYYN